MINALSNLEHPCQALADYFTLQERFGDLKKVTLAYVGDGNNVSHSLMLTAATLGSKIRVATPKGYEPEEEIVTTARAIASQTGAVIEVMNDAKAAVAEQTPSTPTPGTAWAGSTKPRSAPKFLRAIR